MRVLLIHPEDELQDGPWLSQRWDRVIDLGRAGASSYEHAAAGFGCPVNTLDAFRDNFKEKHRVRELLAMGRERLSDDFGLDWWELTSIMVHEQVETVFLLLLFVKTLGPRDEVHVSRPCFQAEVLRRVPGVLVQTFSSAANDQVRGVRHYLHVLKKFPIRQLVEIFWDKTDPGYQIRGLLGPRGLAFSDPVVLLPSAYVNVTCTALAYAGCIPDAHFLLVVTRRSGWIKSPPKNVSIAWLRSYASVRPASRKAEYVDLFRRWDVLRNELQAIPEFRILTELGLLDDFRRRFAVGLEVRDAWRNVLDTVSVQAVICADDSNPYTHIPLLLAKTRGLATIACHHGALDGRYMFKRSHANVLLAKGRMEKDYLVRLCGLLPETVEIGAPIRPPSQKQEPSRDAKPFIVFFSEGYEVVGGRGREFYRDVLPFLGDLALAEGRQLIIKLHHSESLSERNRFVETILSKKQRHVTRVIGGPLQPELLDKTWLGVTVLSTVAVECALRGIPCFLCSWLEAWPYGYIDQFTRFGVGIRLRHPSEIARIPTMLKNYGPSDEVEENCCTPIEEARLRTLLDMAQVLLTADGYGADSSKKSR